MLARNLRKHDYMFIARDQSTNVYIICDGYMILVMHFYIAWHKLISCKFKYSVIMNITW